MHLETLANNENGSLCGTSVVFDPQIIYRKPLDLPTENICALRVRCRTKGVGTMDIFTVHFTTDVPGEGEFTYQKRAEVRIKAGDIAEYDFDLKRCPLWKGTLTGLRFDPIAGEGEFVIESVTFMQDNTSKRLFINDEFHEGIAPQITDNGVFIAFEQNKPLTALKFYHEWYKESKTLYLVHKDKEMFFTVGSATAVVNGKKVELPEPLRTFDSVPMLSLDLLCALCGFSYSVNGRDVFIKA